jgi:RHS repeat-associated protein
LSRAILDSSGSIVGQKGHYPFGEDWYTSSLTNRHFTSYERDSESINDNALHRFFVNRLGRFSTTDPAPGGGGRPQGFNLYNYVGNDPVNRRDPNGLFKILISSDDCYDGDCPSDNHGDGWGGVGLGGGGGGGCENPVGSEGNSCPPNPVPLPPPPTPKCFCQMKYRYITDPPSLKKIHATHSFWYAQDISGTKWILSSGPTNQNGSGFLNSFRKPGAKMYVPPDTPSSGTTWFNSSLSSSNCYGAEMMVGMAQGWPNNAVTYSPYVGPNSNTFAHVLAKGAGFSVSAPPGSYGWALGSLF